jgi:FlaA1/EpsC-like NDP-sugar epimerase
MIDRFGNKKITIKEVGKKPGEKLYEKIVTSTEAEQTLELKEMYVIPQAIDYPNVSEDVVKQSFDHYHKLGGKPVPSEGVKPDKLLTRVEITKLLSATLGN